MIIQIEVYDYQVPQIFSSQFETCILFVVLVCTSYLELLDTTCGTPPVIPNTLKLSNGFNNESMTLYSCNSGFSSNGEDPTIFCNGTHWSITQFNCLGNTCTFEKFTLYSLFMLSSKCILWILKALYSFKKKIIIEIFLKIVERTYIYTANIVKYLF